MNYTNKIVSCILVATMLLNGIVSYAQTDVTEYYLTNAGFDSDFDYKAGETNNVAQEIRTIPGWTQGFTHDYTISGVYEFGFAGKFNTASVPAEGYNGSVGGGLAISTGWSQNFNYTQTVTLPAGTYTLTAPTYNGSDKTAATSMLAWIPNSGTQVKSTVTSYPIGKWTVDKITFKLTAKTTGKIQIGMTAAAGGSGNSAKLVIDYVQLMGDLTTADKTGLKTLLDKAISMYGTGTGIGAADLKTGIDAAQVVFDNAEATMEQVIQAYSSLKAAVTVYGDNNLSEDNPQDVTRLILNPSFESGFDNWTQSAMALQSNASFTKKAGGSYVEKWVAAGNAVGNASIKQTVSLPNGVYKLVVAAQNMNQNSTSQKCTGAYIYAGTDKTTVYTPNDYSVKFTSIKGSVEIGFVANNASGNWLAVDNFRLYQIGYVDNAVAVEELHKQTEEAEKMLVTPMSSNASATLTKAISDAKAITEQSSSDNVTLAAQQLTAAIEAANVSIAAYEELAGLIKTAEAVSGKVMQTATLNTLNNAITAAKAIDGNSTDAQQKTATTKINTAITNANACVTAYASLNTSIVAAEKVYVASMNGAEAFLTAINDAKAAYEAKEITTIQATAMAEDVDKAVLAFRLANATPGTGTAPRVSSTNHYVLTGATEALMRATFVGSNILEQGVCWSTEHNPTVLDSRTTKSFSLNGTIIHVKGLKYATVYYLRPYVMNKTYQVAYGDEVKIVTHPKGTCTWDWDEAGPDDATNDRCRTAIKQTIDYFNEWTGINGFNLSGHYVPGAGAGGGTADCSYGGWMRISQNVANQAIGTVLHETGHGVGVGTSSRYADTNVHNRKWFGREANNVYSFLENKKADPYNSDFCMVGDGTHAWGASATYDWFINGADKDKHSELQYVGGSCLLYGMFVDGLNPTWGYSNGISSYTYNFDDNKKYYLMCKNKDYGLGTGLFGTNQNRLTETTVQIRPRWRQAMSDGEELIDDDAWYIHYDPKTCKYYFESITTGYFLTRSSSTGGALSLVAKRNADTQDFQLMPDRTDVTLGTGTKKITTHGYWFTWNKSGDRAMAPQALSNGLGQVKDVAFDYSDNATAQQWIIISEDEIMKYQKLAAGDYLMGDANGDGIVDMVDANMVVTYLTTGNATGMKKYVADMDNDDKLTLKDAEAIVNVFLGK